MGTVKTRCPRCGVGLEFDPRPGAPNCPVCGAPASLPPPPLPPSPPQPQFHPRTPPVFPVSAAPAETVRTSLPDIFSECLRRHSREDAEKIFLTGAAAGVPAEFPRPWLFLRCAGFAAAAYAMLYFSWDEWRNPLFLPGIIFLGSFAIPVTMTILFFELNAPRDVSFYDVALLFIVGGVMALPITMLINTFIPFLPAWLGPVSAGPVEETAKILALSLTARDTRRRFILNGMLLGAAVGAGFAAFESAGYAFGIFHRMLAGAGMTHADPVAGMVANISQRALLSPFCHTIWTAVAGGALWMVKGSASFSAPMLLSPRFLVFFALSVTLHMAWNSSVPAGVPFFAGYIALGVAAWAAAVFLLRAGLRQALGAPEG